AVDQISGDDIAFKNTPNVLSSLQGEMSGVVVTQSSGQPGEEGLDLKIRGYSSANNMAPLVLIDGMEGSLEALNPNDVESISILKDAASASIYGSKAGGGVVLVTMKSGKGGQGEAIYNGILGFKRQGRRPGRLNSWEEEEIVQRSNDRIPNFQTMEWFKNPNFNTILRSSALLTYYDNTNWVKE